MPAGWLQAQALLSTALCHVSQDRTSCHCFRKRETGPSVSTSFLPPLSLFPISLCLRPPPFLILQPCSFTACLAGVSQGKSHSTTCKHFPCILRFLNRLPTHFSEEEKKKKSKKEKKKSEKQKRHHIPQPSVSPGRL